MPKRIPISAAKRFAAEQGCRQVVIAAWDGERTHVVTFGQTPEDCDQAAQGGDAIKRAMGWPEDANCKPSRLKAAEASRDALAAEVERLRADNVRLRALCHAEGVPTRDYSDLAAVAGEPTNVIPAVTLEKRDFITPAEKV